MGDRQPAVSPRIAATFTEETSTEEETIALGRRIAGDLPRRAVILLIGNLGAGKTTLAKGILGGLGKGLAEPADVSSPTFALIHEYGPDVTGTRAYHIDLYRLDSAAEVATLGLDDIFDQQAVVLIEWGERFPELMPAPRIEIRLRHEPTGDDPERRRIEIRAITAGG